MLTKTKDRVGAVVVAVAAVVGLVLVFSNHQAGGDDDGPATSQTQQVPGQDDDDAPGQAPGAPGQDEDDAPAPGQAPAPAPAAPGQQPPAGADDDGDG